MIWIRVIDIQDPLRLEVPAAIKQYKKAGVEVKMVTGMLSPSWIVQCLGTDHSSIGDVWPQQLQSPRLVV